MTSRDKRKTADEKPAFARLAQDLAEVSRNFYARGWALGTSGNFSAQLSRRPLRLAITPSRADKGQLTAKQIVAIDADGGVVRGRGKPSVEARVHLAVVRARSAGAVLHTHSVWSTIVSEAYADAGGISLEGYEMLKGLASVTTHEHQEWLPILENSQDYAALAHRVEQTLLQHPTAHGFLLRRHGLYSWGRDLAEAKSHVEIFEFLLEVEGRRHAVTSPNASRRKAELKTVSS